MASCGRPKRLVSTEEKRDTLAGWARRRKSCRRWRRGRGSCWLRGGPVEQGGRIRGTGIGADRREVVARFVERAATAGRRPAPGPARVVTAEQVEDVVVSTWSRTRPTRRTGRANDRRTLRAIESTIGRVWKALSCSHIAARTSSCPMTRCLWRRSTTSSGSTSTRPRPRWCCPWTRSLDPGPGPQPAGVSDDARHARETHHDYVRHGTTSLFAAFDIGDGTVITALHRRHRAIEFRKFLATIDAEVPDHLDIHLVCDKYGTHKTPTVQSWLDRHPRFHMHYTPTYSSWINQVERWFAELTRQLLERGDHHSVHALQRTSVPGPPPGTRTQNRSYGPRQPSRSSSHSDA